MKRIQIGMIGAATGAFLHLDALKYIGGIPVELKTLCYNRNRERAEEKRREYGFASITDDYRTMLADPDINVVDIVGTPLTHTQMIREAVEAGKDVICEKPLTGYIARESDPRPVGEKVSKLTMYRSVLEEMDELRSVVEKSGKHFYYAENFVYAPSVQRSANLICRKKSKILMMKAFFGMKGSSSPLAGDWEKFGGGCWYRNGVHPLGAILYLKQQEGKARGEEIYPVSVTADMGRVSGILTEEEHVHINAHPFDVEDNSTVTITFSDGTKATIIMSDTVVGGSQNTIDIFTNDGAMECKLLISDELRTCFMDDKGIEDVLISELNKDKIGWYNAFTTDAISRGYVGELREFLTAISEDRKADLDFDFAYLIMKVVYGAYVAAETNSRFVFE
ncbi:Gfo/Idh/MocA family protein [Dysosmobacter sp.]|uniref:Gfo/Idh/MocA family protein n=1 Tax=Dysosmobacter sp. TaxID=2591382 RepID=UPI002A8ED7F4|nr:Gfo/Idh/MocA family oxidoreductase [Dysosmobacter sp.]MDY3281591.1 Gfo/Idh/MocA family oxidoreductase [Dysosmobacter sp.]